MITFLEIFLPIVTAPLLGALDAAIINKHFGEKINQTKLTTYTFALIAGVINVYVLYQFKVSGLDLIIFSAYFASVRGVFYDVSLNVLRKPKVYWWHMSEKSNSIFEKIYAKIYGGLKLPKNMKTFLMFRFFYVVLSVVLILTLLKLLP